MPRQTAPGMGRLPVEGRGQTPLALAAGSPQTVLAAALERVA